MGFGALKCVDIVRDLVQDAAPGTQYSNSILLDYINAAIQFYIARCAQNAHDIFTRSKDITYVSGQELYRWTSFVQRVVLAERPDLSPNKFVPGMDRQDRHLFLNEAGSDVESWYNQGTQVGVLPTPTSGTLRLWSQACPPPLHYGTCAGGSASGFTMASTASLGTTIKSLNAYAEMPVILSAGTGGWQQTNIIISNTAADPPVCACGFAWTTQPDNTTRYELCPPLPEQFHLIIPLRAALFAKAALEDTVNTLAAMEQDFYSVFMGYISQLDESRPRRVTRTQWE